MCRLRVALFVEGSKSPPGKRDPLAKLWNETLVSALGIAGFHRVYPISKKHLVAMNPELPRPVGAGESFDRMLIRHLNSEPFDAAVVAWDLVPPWDPEREYCRWNEILDFYGLLARSHVLPDEWLQKAQGRLADLQNRPVPRHRLGPPSLERGMILCVWMEPMFESLLVQDERAVKRALGVTTTPEGWPTSGWGDPRERQPDQRVLGRAILSIKRTKPKLQCVRQIPGDMRTNKNEWGEYILRKMLEDNRGRSIILNHPICVRLTELLVH